MARIKQVLNERRLAYLGAVELVSKGQGSNVSQASSEMSGHTATTSSPTPPATTPLSTTTPTTPASTTSTPQGESPTFST
ncbi:uncharacterized protein EI90DRAFT_3068761 [Cantharellus anzutake]|uniref:uncharacterized protein n=1 Tax=Cantharellus anzutake TaxID=1750568 RepID=UPI00190374B4|nr:uncharacterized protein EI90DRAFT_3068761 [Cantharellus anzutake]KAF8326988.1 hypothetical protein EI90DRAFT_3068761 [Cantharellus anzutake]